MPRCVVCRISWRPCRQRSLALPLPLPHPYPYPHLPLLALPQSQPLTLQAENELLRKQNITIASETRQFLDDHRPAKGE